MAERIGKEVLREDGVYWGQSIAQEIVRQRPGKDVYVVSSGISPSGAIHFGNFREIVTQWIVKKELEKMGHNVRFVFVWDDFDAMRKVPAGAPDGFEEHLRKPLTGVPSSNGEGTWASVHEEEFEQNLKDFGIETEFLYQTQAYTRGDYDDAIRQALQQRETIARILLSLMSDKAKAAKEIDDDVFAKGFYPVSIYSTWTGKDTTQILDYDGENGLTYRCKETDNTETIDLTQTHQVSLGWKTDWAMRWVAMGVDFESAGKDHNSPNGAFDASTQIAQQVYGADGPIGLAYEFIGIQGLGAKMSGSKGNSVTPGQLLDIYEVPLLLWLYSRKTPTQRFDLAFNSEILRQYTEFDREVELWRNGELDAVRAEALWIAGANKEQTNPIPMRQAIGFGQIVQWDVDKVMHMLTSLDLEYDRDSVESRLQKAKAYLETYNPEELIELNDQVNKTYAAGLASEQRASIQELRTFLETGVEDIQEIEQKMYAIPKREGMDETEKKKAQRAFFTDVYKLLIGKKAGPRLSTFLWAIDRKQAIDLLSI